MDGEVLFVDQDFFELDVVRYAPGLGDKGIAAYRKEVAAKSTGSDQFAARYAAERLAILDRDVDALVEMLGGDLSSPYQYQRVAEAMVELDLPDEALRWARDGFDRTTGWQVAKLYDLAAVLLSDRGEGGSGARPSSKPARAHAELDHLRPAAGSGRRERRMERAMYEYIAPEIAEAVAARG